MNNSTETNGTHALPTDFVDAWNLVQAYYSSFGCVLAPLMIFSNIVLIVSILYKRELRHEFRYLAIVSIAVSDLIIGIFITPLRVDVGLKGDFVHGCVMHMLATVFEFSIHMFVSMWTMVNMNTDYILKMCYIRTPYLTPQRRRVLFGMILALPWLAMLFIVLPVAYANAGVIMSNKYCRIHLKGSAKLVVISLVYMVPATIILIQVVVMTVVRLYRRNCATRIPATATTVDIPPPWVLVAASAVTVLCILLEQLLFVFNYTILSGSYIMTVVRVWITAEAVSDSKSVILPVVWFIYPDIRGSFCELLKKLPCHRTLDVFRTNLNVSYKVFSDDISGGIVNPI